MRRELAGAFPTPLELLAVERVVAAWLALQHVETQCAKAEGDVAVAKFWLQRQQQAHRLYQAAVKSLLTIRELLPSQSSPLWAPHGTNGDLPERVNGQNGTSVNRVAAVLRNGKKAKPALT